METNSPGGGDDKHGRSGEDAPRDDDDATDQRPRKRTAAEAAMRNKQRWEEMFQRQNHSMDSSGHCRVPNRYKEDAALGNWVSTQRRQYRILMSDASHSVPLTVERARQLMEIGFEWSAKDPEMKTWEERYEELCAFKEKHGHTQIPIGWKTNPKLSTWVSTQRQEYKHLLKGQSSRINWGKVEKLNQIGFTWEAPRGRRRITDSSTFIATKQEIPATSAEVESQSQTTNVSTSCETNNPSFVQSSESSMGASSLLPSADNISDRQRQQMLSLLLQGRLEQPANANEPARRDGDQSSQILELLSNRGISPEALLSMTNRSQFIGHRQAAPQPQIILRQGHHEAASPTSTNNSELLAILQLLSNRGISPESLSSANALQQSPRLVGDAASQPQMPRQGPYETPPTISNSSGQLLLSTLAGQQVQSRPSSEGTGTGAEGNPTNLQQLIALLLVGHQRSQDLRVSQPNRHLAEESLAQLQAAIALSNVDSNLTPESRGQANLRGAGGTQGDLLALLGAHGSQPAAAAGGYRGGLLGGNQGGFRESQETIANVLRSELMTRLSGQQQLQSSLPQLSPPTQPSIAGLSQLLAQRLFGLLGATSSSSSSPSQTSDIASLERLLQAQNTAHLFQREGQMQRPGIEEKHEEEDRKPPAKKPRTQR